MCFSILVTNSGRSDPLPCNLSLAITGGEREGDPSRFVVSFWFLCFSSLYSRGSSAVMSLSIAFPVMACIFLGTGVLGEFLLPINSLVGLALWSWRRSPCIPVCQLSPINVPSAPFFKTSDMQLLLIFNTPQHGALPRLKATTSHVLGGEKFHEYIASETSPSQILSPNLVNLRPLQRRAMEAPTHVLLPWITDDEVVVSKSGHLRHEGQASSAAASPSSVESPLVGPSLFFNFDIGPTYVVQGLVCNLLSFKVLHVTLSCTVNLVIIRSLLAHLVHIAFKKSNVLFLRNMYESCLLY